MAPDAATKTNGTNDAAATTPAPPEAPGGLTSDVLTKYKTAADIVQRALKSVLGSIKDGANIIELCQQGDKVIEEGTSAVYNKGGKVKISKGVAFPTSIAPNNITLNYSPLPSDTAGPKQLAENDIVKILLGAQIDGYASIAAETVVVPASSGPFTNSAPLTGVRADLISAAHNAAEAALRTVKAGIKNWEVTDVVSKVLKEYEAAEGEEGGIKGVEGSTCFQHEKNVLDGKKKILLGVTNQQKQEKDNQFTLEEGEVYGLDVVVTSGSETKLVSDISRTTIYSKTNSTYLLKLKTARATFTEITKKAGAFPFTLRTMDDEKKARMGVQEPVQHGLIRAWELFSTPRPNDLTAQVFVTFAVGKAAATRITHPPSSDLYHGLSSGLVGPEAIIKPTKEIKDEELKKLLARGLKPSNKKKAKKAGGENEEAKDATA